MHTLVGLAELRIVQGEEGQATGLLQAVLVHHAAQQPDKDVAARLLHRIAPEDRVTKAPDLQEIAADIVEVYGAPRSR